MNQTNGKTYPKGVLTPSSRNHRSDTPMATRLFFKVARDRKAYFTYRFTLGGQGDRTKRRASS